LNSAAKLQGMFKGKKCFRCKKLGKKKVVRRAREKKGSEKSGEPSGTSKHYEQRWVQRKRRGEGQSNGKKKKEKRARNCSREEGNWGASRGLSGPDENWVRKKMGKKIVHGLRGRKYRSKSRGECSGRSVTPWQPEMGKWVGNNIQGSNEQI